MFSSRNPSDNNENERYQLLEIIGRGTYGEVNRAIDLKFKQVVAIKTLRKFFYDEGIPAYALGEISCLKNFHHPNIVKMLDVIAKPSKLQLVFEYHRDSLSNYIYPNTTNRLLTNLQIKFILYQILIGVCVMHQNQILHRDIKPDNILIDDGDIIKIADFGLSRIFYEPGRPYTPSVQTLWYRAPELLLGSRDYTMAIDMWSVGCIFYELVEKKVQFPGTEELSDQMLRIFRTLGTPTDRVWAGVSKLPLYSDKIPMFTASLCRDRIDNPELSNSGYELQMKMLRYDPNQRISCFEAVNHEYFSELSDLGYDNIMNQNILQRNQNFIR